MTNAFDGVYGSDPNQGRCATTTSGQTLVWQPSSLTVNDKIEVWTREGKLTVNDGAEFASSVNMGWKDLSGVSPATPFDLTKLTVTGDPSNAGEIFAIRIDGLVLVDPQYSGVAGALGNYLRQTWAEYNGLAPQLSAASPENVALFNALNTKMTAYPTARQAAVNNLTTKIVTLSLSNTEKKVLAMSGVVPLS